METQEVLGYWDKEISSIVLNRKTLKSLSAYAGVLIHELIHAETDYNDVTRAFEYLLTEKIGDLCSQILGQQGKLTPFEVVQKWFFGRLR